MSISQQLTIPNGVQFFRKELIYFGEMRRSMNFWQARHLGYGRREYGEEKVAEAMDQMSLEFADVEAMETLQKLETSPRSELSAEHHFVLAKAGVDAEAQTTWLETAWREKLTPVELRKSIIAGKVIRSEASGNGPHSAGVASPHAVRQQFDFWVRQAGDGWRGLDRGQKEQLLGLLAPIAALVAEIEVDLAAMAAGEEGVVK